MSNHHDNMLEIATLGKSVGLDGSLKIYLSTDFPEQFKKGVNFFISSSKDVTIEKINLDKEIVKFEGINSPEDAKKLTNKKLYTTLQRTKNECELKDGEYFWFDLQGCALVENGSILGEVTDVQRLGPNDFLYINSSEEIVEKGLAKSFLVPYLPEFILSVDLDSKQIEASGALDILEAS